MRADTFVIDEPFYPVWAKKTDCQYLGAKETVENCETDYNKVTEKLLMDFPNDKSIYYQKHMAKHMMPSDNLNWTSQTVNCFLIREPREMIGSWLKVDPRHESRLVMADFAYPRMLALYKELEQGNGERPLVLCYKDILMNPEGVLKKWCQYLRVEYMSSMLSWEPGRRDGELSSNVNFYRDLEMSTGFREYEKRDYHIPESVHGILRECEIVYNELHPFGLRLSP